MYWSQYDTLLLVTGILTLLLTFLPVKTLKPVGRVAAFLIGIVLIIAAVTLGNMPSFTYPWLVTIGPVIPIGAAILLIVQHVRSQGAQAREEANPFVPTSIPNMAPQAVPAAVPVVVQAFDPAALAPAAPPHPDLAAAQDPATPQETLADLAFRVPETRAAVAANPSAYPALLEWLAQFDDPKVVDALARRNQ
jgi:hypothetical protein